MEAHRRDSTRGRLWRWLQRIWGFLSRRGPDDSGVKLSVEETTLSSVRPWFDPPGAGDVSFHNLLTDDQ